MRRVEAKYDLLDKLQRHWDFSAQHLFFSLLILCHTYDDQSAGNSDQVCSIRSHDTGARLTPARLTNVSVVRMKKGGKRFEVS